MGQKKNVKMEDIAETLGVSVVTVSNALKGKKGVSDSLRKKIADTAEKMTEYLGIIGNNQYKKLPKKIS